MAFEAIKLRHIYVFFHVTVNTYVPIFQVLDARGDRKLRKDTHMHARTYIYTHARMNARTWTRDNYSNDNKDYS